MQRRIVDSKIEKQIVTGLIVSKDFLARVADAMESKYFQAAHYRQIVKWCIRYFIHYKDAPGKKIENLFHAWQERKNPSPDLAEAIAAMLGELSDAYESTGEELNVAYLVDETAAFVESRKLQLLRDEIDLSLSKGDVAAASASVSNFSHAPIGADAGIDMLNAPTAWEAAFAAAQKPLITFNDPVVDRFLSAKFTRDSFIGILAPEKRGKTWFCIEFAIRGLMSRRRVAFFAVGDMSEGQLLKRFGCRITGRPLFAEDCGDIEIPTGIQRAGDKADVSTKIVRIPKPLSLGACKTGIEKFNLKHGLAGDVPYLMLSTHAAGTVSVHDIETTLDRWETEKGFIPDIIITDYADIMADEPGLDAKAAPRDKSNARWLAFRRLSQERHCLVITPTQADAESYGADVLGKANFTEDKRKNAHVTATLGLNQTDEEKGAGIMRLNWILVREGYFSEKQCLHVAQCLRLGRAYCYATL